MALHGFTTNWLNHIKSRIEDIEAWLVGYCWMSLDGKIGKCFASCFVCCAQVQSTPSSGHRFAAFGRPWAWCWGCCRPWPAGFGTYPTSATLRDLWRHQQASDGECIHSRQNRQTSALHGPSWPHMDPYGPFMSLLVQIRQISDRYSSLQSNRGVRVSYIEDLQCLWFYWHLHALVRETAPPSAIEPFHAVHYIMQHDEDATCN